MTSFLADSYLHDLNPFAIRFTESFGVRWYGLAYAAGFVVVWLFIRWMARTDRSPLPVPQVGDLMTWIIVGVLVGGRLGYAIFYDPSLFGFEAGFPWWNMFRIYKGGMASHGGILGVIVISILYGRRHGVSPLHLLDLSAFSCTAGLFFGRIANFVNGELWGRRLPAEMQSNTDAAADPPWWSVKYPEEILAWADTPREFLLRRDLDIVAGDQGFLPKVVETLQAGEAQTVAVVKPMLTAFHPSQIFQAVTDGPILVGILALFWLRPRRPGVIGAWFLVVYGVLRILTEFFRQPDEGVDVWLGLSRGQWLSVVMVIAGAIIVPWCARRPVEKLGGLLARPTATPGSRTGT